MSEPTRDRTTDNDRRLVGARIGGYDITAAIARGATNDVYLGRLPGLERQAAIKVPWDVETSVADEGDRLIAQARYLAATDHPNIVRIYKCGFLDEGRPYLALEYLKGLRLDTLIRKGPLPVPWAVRIARETARGLAALHAQDVVCLGLRPEGIMVVAGPLCDDSCRKNWVRVFDLSAAQAAGCAADPSTLRAHSGSPYLAPEAIEQEKVSARSDVFTLTAILHEMVCGRPRSGASSPLVAPKVESGSPLAQLIETGLSQRPDSRPNDMYLFLGLLDEAEIAWSRSQ